MRISERFKEIVRELPECELLAEIGCDHAILTKLALEGGKCKRAVVSDISAKCLNKARITLAGYGNSITYAVGDGIVDYEEEPNCLLICGMGGHTIADIIGKYSGKATLVLSPQSHAEQVRAELKKIGYVIEKDRCFKCEGKFYDVIRAVKGEELLSDLQIKYGKFYKEKNEALKERIELQLNKLSDSGEKRLDKKEELEEVLRWQK